MLSIRFDHAREWWTPNLVFKRLFQSALESGQLRTDIREWQHVAEANGGLSLVDIEPAVARSLTSGLRAAASAELARLGDVEERSEDGTYKASLAKLLLLIHEL